MLDALNVVDFVLPGVAPVGADFNPEGDLGNHLYGQGPNENLSQLLAYLSLEDLLQQEAEDEVLYQQLLEIWQTKTWNQAYEPNDPRQTLFPLIFPALMASHAALYDNPVGQAALGIGELEVALARTAFAVTAGLTHMAQGQAETESILQPASTQMAISSVNPAETLAATPLLLTEFSEVGPRYSSTDLASTLSVTGADNPDTLQCLNWGASLPVL